MPLCPHHQAILCGRSRSVKGCETNWRLAHPTNGDSMRSSVLISAMVIVVGGLLSSRTPIQGNGRATETATFGAGCFWGVEEAFRHVKGVTDTSVGYMGGTLKNPTYEQVSTHRTGYSEVCQV